MQKRLIHFLFILFFFQSSFLPAQVRTELPCRRSALYDRPHSALAVASFEEAKKYGSVGLYQLALKTFRQVIADDSAFAEAYEGMADVYVTLRQFNRAATLYRQCVVLYPAACRSHRQLATIYSVKHRYDEALEEFRICQQLEPASAESYFGAIPLYIRKHDYKAAVKSAARALEIYASTSPSRSADAQYFLGLSYYLDHDLPNARIYLTLARQQGFSVPTKLLSELDIKMQ